MIFISSYISGKNHCRYRPDKQRVQYDLALVKVIEPIKFSDQVMPICLPSKRFPDEKGVVYVAGWGLHHESTKRADCTTGKNGPDPFSKCKFPFIRQAIAFKQCLETKPPSEYIEGCKELLKLKERRAQRRNKTANMLVKGYGRGSTFIFLKLELSPESRIESFFLV